MTDIKQLFKTFIADSLVNSFAPNSDDSMYLFIARPNEWTGASGDAVPDTFTDSTESHYDIWNRMIASKRITSSEVLLMIKKNEWTSGTKYIAYDSSIDMLKDDPAFYVMNSEKNVYKCLFNNGDVASTDSPRGAQIEPTTTNDGYVWKFMFKIPESLQSYITEDYIPVRNLSVEQGQPNRFDDDRHLQYTAQYEAVDGAIEYINVTGVSEEYGNSVISNVSGTGQKTKVNSGASGSVDLSGGYALSSVDDTYNGYAITVVSGTGVGQTRLIDDYSANGNVVYVTPDWETVPDNTSYYEIMPRVLISGDGVSAEATSSVVSSSDKSINKITMTNNGSGYKRATATISTSPTYGATLDVMISPPGGHASDPASELSPDRVMLVARLERDESGVFPVVNDFRQYGIIKNPVISSGYTGAGEIAGSEVDIFSDIKIKSATGSNFQSGSFNNGEIVFGTESQACGKIENWSRSTDFSKGKMKLRNVYGKFKTNEKVIGVSNTSGDVWTSSSKPVGYVEFQDDAYLSQASNNYRLSTRMVVGATSGLSEDDTVTGASWGSTASVISYIAITGGTLGELLVTGIHRSGTADADGFSVGEFVSGSEIYTIEIPQFVEGSGTILHINNVVPISRHFEQEEELRIIIDL